MLLSLLQGFLPPLTSDFEPHHGAYHLAPMELQHKSSFKVCKHKHYFDRRKASKRSPSHALEKGVEEISLLLRDGEH